jgi:four helix bundle protein
MGKTLEELRIYQAAEELCDAIWEQVIQWERFARDTAGRQLVEAADSIGANIAEGYGRYHFREDLTFLYYARGSAKETGGSRIHQSTNSRK